MSKRKLVRHRAGGRSGMRHAISFIACAVGFCLAWAAHAQDYPNRPVRIIVPTQAGGVSDILSRTFANLVQSRTGATVVVENRTGATGLLSIEVARKHPHLKCISFDLPPVESIARKAIA